MRLAVVGHVEWVDFMPVPRLPAPGEVVHAEHVFARAAGGGGVAAAVMAGLAERDGSEVDFFCALGRDERGRAAAAQLHARSVRLHVAWRDEPTRRAVTMLDGAGERTIVTAGRRLQASGGDDLPWERLRAADAVYFTAGDAGALALARQARVVVASPRARDAFGARASAEDRAPAAGVHGGQPAEHGGTGAVDAIVFSEHDRDEHRWARVLEGRARLMVATEGAQGGRWWGACEGRWEPSAPPGRPRDSYGCGDSFAAGFTFALAAGRSVADAAALGALCGARCLARPGAP